MNNKGVGPNLTVLFIGIGVFILIFTLANNIYSDFMVNNGGSIDNEYASQYAAITSYQNNLTSFQEAISGNLNIWSSIPTGLASTFNVLVIGVGGILTFFDYLGVLPSLFNTVITGASGLGIPGIFITFIIFALTVFLIMKVYKAIRNTQEEP